MPRVSKCIRSDKIFLKTTIFIILLAMEDSLFVSSKINAPRHSIILKKKKILLAVLINTQIVIVYFYILKFFFNFFILIH